MTLQERVESILESYMIGKAGGFEMGYYAETTPDGSVLLRWGYGEPFNPNDFLSDGLKRCVTALQSANLDVVPSPAGLALLVRGNRSTAARTARSRAGRTPEAPDVSLPPAATVLRLGALVGSPYSHGTAAP